MLARAGTPASRYSLCRFNVHISLSRGKRKSHDEFFSRRSIETLKRRASLLARRKMPAEGTGHVQPGDNTRRFTFSSSFRSLLSRSFQQPIPTSSPLANQGRPFVLPRSYSKYKGQQEARRGWKSARAQRSHAGQIEAAG